MIMNESQLNIPKIRTGGIMIAGEKTIEKMKIIRKNGRTGIKKETKKKNNQK